MKVKSKIFGKSIKIVFALMAICGGIFTSCYEKDDLDITPPGVKPTPDAAVYYVKGMITDYENGNDIAADYVTLSNGEEIKNSSAFNFTLSKSGEYVLTVRKDGYEDVSKNFTIAEIEAGEESYTDVSVALRAISGPVDPQPEPDVEASYTIEGTVNNKETSELIEGTLSIDGKSYPITNGVYSKIDVTSGTHLVQITAAGYYAYSSVIQINKVMFKEPTVINHVFDFELTPEGEDPGPGPTPEDPTYPVVAQANIDGVTFKLTGTNNKGESVNETATNILNVQVKAGSYILTAEAQDYDKQAREFVLTAATVEGYAWYAVFEKDPVGPVDPILYDVTTYLDVIVLNNETGEDITGSVSITVNDNAKTTNGFTTKVGDNVVRVTDSSKTYYGTTYLVSIDKQTSETEGETRTVYATVRLNEIPVDPVNPTPDPVYTVKAVAEDANVLFNLYSVATGALVDAGRGGINIELSEAGTYYMTASRDEKIISSPYFDLDEDTPNYIWSVRTVDMPDGSLVALPDQDVTTTLANTNSNGVTNELISSLEVTIPAGAVDEPTNINISLIANDRIADVNSPSASVLTFVGTPSGLTFNVPLEFSFADEFGLGDMELYYLQNNAWTQEGSGLVASSNGTYVAGIPHFSTFKFGFPGSFSEAPGSDVVKSGSGTIYNGTYYSKEVTFKYTVNKGMALLTDLDVLVASIGTIKGKELVKIIIEDLIYAHTSARLASEYAEDQIEQKFTIPALKVLTSATATQSFTVQTYTITINGQSFVIEVGIAGATVLATQMDDISHGHGHGHGHGNDWNAGGGIVIAE